MLFAALVLAIHFAGGGVRSRGGYSVRTSRTMERSDEQSEPVNVNTADEETLCRLPGIGPALAERIVADRSANGPFASVDDLTRVSGIGEKTLETLRPYVTVGGEEAQGENTGS